MSDDAARRVLIGTFFLACATIIWSDVKTNGTVPAPYRFVGAGMVYGILSILAGPLGAPTVALAGVGYYLVLLYKFFGVNLSTEGPSSAGEATPVTPGGTIIGNGVSSIINLINGSPRK